MLPQEEQESSKIGLYVSGFLGALMTGTVGAEVGHGLSMRAERTSYEYEAAGAIIGGIVIPMLIIGTSWTIKLIRECQQQERQSTGWCFNLFNTPVERDIEQAGLLVNGSDEDLSPTPGHN